MTGWSLVVSIVETRGEDSVMLATAVLDHLEEVTGTVGVSPRRIITAGEVS